MKPMIRHEESRRTTNRRAGQFERWGDRLHVRDAQHGIVCRSHLISTSEGTLLTYFEDGMWPADGAVVDAVMKGSTRALRAEVRDLCTDGAGGAIAKLQILDDQRSASRRRRTGRRDADLEIAIAQRGFKAA